MTPIIIGAIVLAVAILLGWLFMSENMMDDDIESLPPVETAGLPASPEEVAVGAEDATAGALSTQGTSDELSDIEADLNATDMGALDGIDQI